MGTFCCGWRYEKGAVVVEGYYLCFLYVLVGGKGREGKGSCIWYVCRDVFGTRLGICYLCIGLGMGWVDGRGEKQRGGKERGGDR